MADLYSDLKQFGTCHVFLNIDIIDIIDIFSKTIKSEHFWVILHPFFEFGNNMDVSYLMIEQQYS